MLKKRVGVVALALSSLFGLSTIAAARDHDRDDYRYNNGYGRMSDHERHEMEERREKDARKARKEWEKEQRRAARNGYYNNGYYGPYNNNGYYGPYNNNGYYNGPYRNNGYYDRYGNWHPYR